MSMMMILLLLVLQEDPGRIEFFERRIRPVLVERCFKCHSADGEAVKGDLRLDTREGVLRGVVPGDPGNSPLIKAIRYSDAELRMPPKERLTPAQVGDFETWVLMGAPSPTADAAAPAKPAYDFAAARAAWPFRPVERVSRPAILDLPKPEGDPRALLRRATFDLTGLPPTPEEVDAFLADGDFAKVVDRLLASPRYGERWGRRWLDLVRYADTAGDSADYPVPQARRYRDYVIDAFNRDLPYDRFIREQVAGDLLPFEGDADRRTKIVATGFLAIARRFGEEPTIDHALTIDDTIDTLGRSILGLTLSCARCHDHKFDPIPAADYYGLYGIFQGTRYPYAGSDKMKYQEGFVPLEADGRLKEHAEKLAALDAEIKALEGKARNEALKRRESLAKSAPRIEDAYAVSEGTPGDARIHLKGNPQKPGALVPRRFLQVLGGQALPPGTSGSGRLELAGWLVEAPLTARVMANRIWQGHFGEGLVRTPSYFGKQGLAPADPGPLDFLADAFVRSGWSVKALHRLIMNSRAYRAVDVPRRRLEAEEIRDAILAVSGALDLAGGGEHPFPPRETWVYSKASPFYAVYPSERRSVYLMQQRLKKHPFLALFDGADTNASTAGRGASVTSLQALFLMNSPFVHEQAARFAARLRGEPRERIDQAHRLALGRPAREEELRRAEAFLVSEDRWTSFAKVLFSSNEFLHVD
jgi:hypothetical protein